MLRRHGHSARCRISRVGLCRAGREGCRFAQRKDRWRGDGGREGSLDREAPRAEGEQEAVDDHRQVRQGDALDHQRPFRRRVVRLRPVEHGLHVRWLRTASDRRRGVSQEGGGESQYPHASHERRREQELAVSSRGRDWNQVGDLDLQVDAQERCGTLLDGLEAQPGARRSDRPRERLVGRHEDRRLDRPGLGEGPRHGPREGRCRLLVQPLDRLHEGRRTRGIREEDLRVEQALRPRFQLRQHQAVAPRPGFRRGRELEGAYDRRTRLPVRSVPRGLHRRGLASRDIRAYGSRPQEELVHWLQ